MQLVRLKVANFRNLASVDIPLVGGAVVVGENRAGKSNLLYALRLVLDPSLSSQQRTLIADDFSEALGDDPMGTGEAIEVSVELGDFEDDAGIVAVLAGALVEGAPMRARLTYRFGPDENEPNQAAPSYSWTIFGGGDPARRIGSDLRRFLHHEHLEALRDAEGDLRAWRRSPLRPILEEVARTTTADDLKKVKEALESATSTVRELDSVQRAADAIEERTAALAGQLHRLEPTLDLAPSDPERTLRSLRLYLDGTAQRGLDSASLGALNVLYIALQQLELARRIGEGKIEHALTSIEEPEAHLHPHLQRRMFRGLLDQDGPKRSTIVSTHSPHIVSVTSPKRLVILREVDGVTHAFAANSADLTKKAWDDLARYLDATRSELVFARRVILVEGFAEQVLLPRIAAPDIDFDENGISVCVVHGTHFHSYVALLRAIGTPYVVITDGDPGAGKGKTGPERIDRLRQALGQPDADPAALGLFLGNDTFEVDLFDSSEANQDAMIAALNSFGVSDSVSQRLTAARQNRDLSGADFFKLVTNKETKGRFAQRVAASVESLDSPQYIRDAIDQLVS